MKKIVVELDLHDEKQKQKAMSAVSGFTGIHSIAMNMKDKKLTVVGNVDPLDVVNKLKKYGNPKLLTVVTARNEEHGRNGKKKVEPTKAQKNPGKRPIVPQSTTISGFTKIFQSVALHDVPGTRGNKWELEAVAIKLKGSGNPPRIKRV